MQDVEAAGFSLPLASSRAVGGLQKRLFDILGACALILFFSPVMLLVAIIVRLSDPGRVTFGHMRRGANGSQFRCLKFRTMVMNSSEVLEDLLAKDVAARIEWQETQKLRNDPRITWIGRILRESSLDELPQLFNVLRGEMSLVGPRPIVDDEIFRYGADYRYYQVARPGLTGLWQVSGRSNCDYARRVKFDVEYVTNWSLWGDIKILWRTIAVVLTREGSV